MGTERARLRWAGDRITWRIGTGQTPYYREDHKASMALLDGYLPVIAQRWENEGLRYEEEAFATLLRGPLAPSAARNEQTPAVLMLRIAAVNNGASERTAHIWMDTQPGEELTLDGTRLYGAGRIVRAAFDSAGGARPAMDSNRAHLSFPVPPGSQKSVIVKLPFVSDLTAGDEQELEGLNYDAQRVRIAEYWKEIVGQTARLSVPEPALNLFAKAVPWHIRMSTAKDPASGLYMVPAAELQLSGLRERGVFPGPVAGRAWRSPHRVGIPGDLLKLQGSKSFPGLHQGWRTPSSTARGSTRSTTTRPSPTVWIIRRCCGPWANITSTPRQGLAVARLAATWRRPSPGFSSGHRRGAPHRTATAFREDRLLPRRRWRQLDWASWFSINSFAWAGWIRGTRAPGISVIRAARVRRKADSYREELREAILRAARRRP